MPKVRQCICITISGTLPSQVQINKSGEVGCMSSSNAINAFRHASFTKSHQSWTRESSKTLGMLCCSTGTIF